jgi:hypothetical protein
MWVKKYHRALKSFLVSPKPGIDDLLEYVVSILKSLDEIDEAKDVFIESLHDKIWDGMMQYFPEMEQYADEIENQFNDIIKKHYDEIFDDALAIIYQFIDNPLKSDEGYLSYKNWKSDEELSKQADKYALNVSEEIRENFHANFLLSLKNMRHYNHFGDIVHQKILASLTDIFEDIPELSGNGIRYFDCVMRLNSVEMFDDLKSILADKVVDLYDEELYYKKM